MAESMVLESFEDAQAFPEWVACPAHVPVDPPGFEELHGHWPVDPAGLRAYVRHLRRRGQRVSYQFLHKQRTFARLVARLDGQNHRAARGYLVEQMRETYGVGADAMSDEQFYERLCYLVQDARAAVTWFNERYVADALQFNLTSEGMLETRKDPIDMLREIALNELSIPPPDRRRPDPDRLRRVLMFRMRRDLALAMRLLGIGLYMERLTAGRYFEDLLTQALERDFFVPNLCTVTEVHVAIDAQTGRPRRILDQELKVRPTADERLEIVPMITRYFRGPYPANGKPARLYPVFYNPAGQKRSWDILFKMMARGVTNPWNLNDLLRAELVFKNEQQMGLGIQTLCERVFTAPGMVRRIEDTRLFRPDRKVRNPASSDNLREVRIDLMYQGLPGELQLCGLWNALAARTMINDLSHRSYKLRQTPRILPILHPADIFWVDWEEPTIRARVLEG